MRTHPARQLLALLLASTPVTGACSPPLTDISATSTEDVGPWDVADAQVEGGALNAVVCMSDTDAADKISDRLLLQLRNKGYARINLSMVASDREGKTRQQLVSWTAREGKQMQAASDVTQNVCTNQQENPAAEETR
jgi:hypothetical protein